jgi:hypothetical protein
MGNTRTPRAPSGSSLPYWRGNTICIAGRSVVSLEGENTLYRVFDSRFELLDGGLYFRRDVLTLARAAGAVWIVAKDRYTGRRWQISLDAFRDKGRRYDHTLYGSQWGCDLSLWEQMDEGHAPEPVQLSFLDGGER